MRGRRPTRGAPPAALPRILKALCRPRGRLRGKLEKMSENEARPPDPAEEQLSRVVGECEARLTEYAELAAHVRHEINNPLTGLIGQAQLLLREELSDTARRRVQTIEQLANRIRDTVASLRDIQTPQPAPRPAGGFNNDGANDPPRH
jgi:two-component system, NtrC family, sensor kinase